MYPTLLIMFPTKFWIWQEYTCITITDILIKYTMLNDPCTHQNEVCKKKIQMQ
ncbi:hypothetical protein Mapa_005162 [Marchantia paleacea]|nr:hypothetical protein Mapa_005162 [Marchantia paleacea]